MEHGGFPVRVEHSVSLENHSALELSVLVILLKLRVLFHTDVEDCPDVRLLALRLGFSAHVLPLANTNFIPSANVTKTLPLFGERFDSLGVGSLFRPLNGSGNADVEWAVVLWCFEPVLSFRFPGHLAPNRHGRRDGFRRVRAGSARALLVLLLMRRLLGRKLLLRMLLLRRMLLMRMLLLMLLRSVRTRPSTRTGRDGVTALGRNGVTVPHEARAGRARASCEASKKHDNPSGDAAKYRAMKCDGSRAGRAST